MKPKQFIQMFSGLVCLLMISGAPALADPQPAPADSTLPDYQRELLALAFETASAIPHQPHLKDRSRTQEMVIEACLELGQVRTAEAYARRIDNWRRGAALAGVAYHLARTGRTEGLDEYLAEAQAAMDLADQDWRRDRIRVKIARVHDQLNRDEKADAFAAHLEDSEVGKRAAGQADSVDRQQFDRFVKKVDELVARGNFDVTRNSLAVYSGLYRRFYDDVQKRKLLHERMTEAMAKFPVILRLKMLLELAGHAVNHGDQAGALELVNQAQALLDEYTWPLEHRIDLGSRIAALRYQSGDVQRARTDADALWAEFQAEGQKIVNIWRAGALRPLAEAYQIMGEKEMALAVYRRALAEGVVNPNSRPRAEDLAATCVSMALNEFDPGEALWSEIRRIHEGLGNPW